MRLKLGLLQLQSDSPSGGLQLSPPMLFSNEGKVEVIPVLAGGFWMSSFRVGAVGIQRYATPTGSQQTKQSQCDTHLQTPTRFKQRAASKTYHVIKLYRRKWTLLYYQKVRAAKTIF